MVFGRLFRGDDRVCIGRVYWQSVSYELMGREGRIHRVSLGALIMLTGRVDRVGCVNRVG